LNLCSLIATGQKEYHPAKLITAVPFKTFSGGIIVLKLTLENNEDSLNFILDTGASDISLDSSTCSKYKMEPLLSDRYVVGIGGSRRMKMIYNRTMHLEGLRIDSLNLMVADYDILGSIYGEKIDGILGNVFFSKYIVRIDYDSSKIYVYSKGSIRYPRGGFLLKPTFAILPIQATYVRDNLDVNSHFYFDIGAGLCLLLSNDFVNDSSFLKPKRKPLTMQAQGLGGKADLKITYVEEVRLGPYRFRKVPTYIFYDEHHITNYPTIGGLLGNDLLRRFNIIFNYDKQDIYLYPNSHFRDPFDYSYTGLSIYYIDGKVRVGDIVKDSPAEKAGFKVDDIILAVENDFTGNIQSYIQLLQSTSGKINVIVKRGTSIAQLKLRPISIL